MVDISIVDGGYKLTYNWGGTTLYAVVPHPCQVLEATILCDHWTGPKPASRRAGQGDKLAAGKKKRLADPSNPGGRFLVDFCWKRNKLDLVGGLEHEWIMTFHSVWNFIIPTDDSSYFSEGLVETTSQGWFAYFFYLKLMVFTDETYDEK